MAGTPSTSTGITQRQSDLNVRQFLDSIYDSDSDQDEDDIEEADSGDTDAAADMLMPGFDPSKSKGGK